MLVGPFRLRKVMITKASDPNAWYIDDIGKAFFVYKKSKFKKHYKVCTELEPNILKRLLPNPLIDENDCVEVAPDYEESSQTNTDKGG